MYIEIANAPMLARAVAMLDGLRPSLHMHLLINQGFHST
jgi:hypothetical protein